MSAGPEDSLLLAERSHGTPLKKAVTSSWPEISMQCKTLFNNTSGLKDVGSILILLRAIMQKARLQEKPCGHWKYSASGKTDIMNLIGI